MNATHLDRLLDPLTECLTAEAAQKILGLRADTELQARVDELADKANRGALSADERTEYDQYLAAYHLITLMQARARRRLSA